MRLTVDMKKGVVLTAPQEKSPSKQQMEADEFSKSSAVSKVSDRFCAAVGAKCCQGQKNGGDSPSEASQYGGNGKGSRLVSYLAGRNK